MALVAALSALAGGVTAWAVASKRAQSKEPDTAKVATKSADSSNPRIGYPARVVQMPHPDWVPGTKQPHPFGSDKWTAYDPSVEEKAASYPLVISSIVPRPIALVSSCSPDGQVNLAPYSYFNAMGHNPVTLCIGINRSPGRGGGKKDTLVNIEETGEFVVNIMSEWYVEAANHSCGDYEPGVDEMALAGLTPVESVLVRPPRVKESAVHMECKLTQVVDIPGANGQPSVAIVIGQVVMLHIHEGVQGRTPTGKLVVDPIKLQPICRLGGTMYGRVTELFDIGRPGSAQKDMGPALYTQPFKAADTNPEQQSRA